MIPSVADDHLIVGKLVGAFGIKGGLKVLSYTRPRENILQFPTWYLNEGEEFLAIKLVRQINHSKSLVVILEDIASRDAAEALVGKEVYLQRSQLPAPKNDEIYWADLIGLEVRTLAGERLGTVQSLLDTGANDVLVVVGDKERLIPYIWDVVIEVDLLHKRIIVDWDVDF